jgi:hypothetical protein
LKNVFGTSGAVAALLLMISGVATISAREVEDDIARAIVIGEAYASGNVYFAGFIEDDTRHWPSRIVMMSLKEPASERMVADFQRPLRSGDSVEIGQFRTNEGHQFDIETPTVFDTYDRAAVVDHPLGVYSSRDVRETMSVIGAADGVALTGVSIKQRGQRRPVTALERKEIADQRLALPKDIECTTEPQWVDSAEIILTARVAASKANIRLSSYQNPGCAGHLSTIYVLDVMVQGRQLRRFEFRHYQGVM